MSTENKFEIDDFTKALAECINQAQCAVVDPMAHAEIWKEELLELAQGKEPVSEDLEEAVNAYIGYAPEVDESSSTYGKRQAFKAGANWQKQQMMAKAVDSTVHIDAGGYPYIPQMELYDYDKDIPLAKEGEKVKVIVIKEN
jgi:hypothetical protein